MARDSIIFISIAILTGILVYSVTSTVLAADAKGPCPMNTPTSITICDQKELGIAYGHIQDLDTKYDDDYNGGEFSAKKVPYEGFHFKKYPDDRKQPSTGNNEDVDGIIVPAHSSGHVGIDAAHLRGNDIWAQYYNKEENDGPITYSSLDYPTTKVGIKNPQEADSAYVEITEADSLWTIPDDYANRPKNDSSLPVDWDVYLKASVGQLTDQPPNMVYEKNDAKVKLCPDGPASIGTFKMRHVWAGGVYNNYGEHEENAKRKGEKESDRLRRAVLSYFHYQDLMDRAEAGENIEQNGGLIRVVPQQLEFIFSPDPEVCGTPEIEIDIYLRNGQHGSPNKEELKKELNKRSDDAAFLKKISDMIDTGKEIQSLKISTEKISDSKNSFIFRVQDMESGKKVEEKVDRDSVIDLIKAFTASEEGTNVCSKDGHDHPMKPGSPEKIETGEYTEYRYYCLMPARNGYSWWSSGDYGAYRDGKLSASKVTWSLKRVERKYHDSPRYEFIDWNIYKRFPYTFGSIDISYDQFLWLEADIDLDALQRKLECCPDLKEDVEKTKEEIKNRDNSNSVYLVRDIENFAYSGTAYHFLPEYTFNKDVTRTFNYSALLGEVDGDDVRLLIYEDDSILDECQYDVLLSNNYLVDSSGMEIIVGALNYSIPPGAVDSSLDLNVEILYLRECFCNNGVQDNGEQGIDCGGECSTSCPPSCDDDIQNGDEEGIDCGGSCPECYPEHCSNEVQDQDEEGIDCGGSCILDIPSDEDEYCEDDLNRNCMTTKCNRCNISSECDPYCQDNYPDSIPYCFLGSCSCYDGCEDIVCLGETTFMNDSFNIYFNPPPEGIYQRAWVYRTGSIYKKSFLLCDRSRCTDPVTLSYSTPESWISDDYIIKIFDYSDSSWKHYNFTNYGSHHTELNIEVPEIAVIGEDISIEIAPGSEGVNKMISIRDHEHDKVDEIILDCPTGICKSNVTFSYRVPGTFSAGSYYLSFYDYNEPGYLQRFKNIQFEVEMD